MSRPFKRDKNRKVFLLFPFVLILIIACSSPQNPQPPAQTQQCGTISTADIHNASLAQAVGVCFWKAFQQCNPASLTYIASDQEVRTFAIKKTSSKCMIQDTVQPGTATTQHITYTCSDVQAFRGGNGALMFINCGNDGSIVVPVNPAIQ